MLHIFLLILKILGILLLTVLCVVLALVLLVLFVPVRYRGDGAFHGKPKGAFMVSWLLHLLTARAEYDQGLKVKVKILWFKVFEETLLSEKDEEEDEDFPAEDELEELVHATGVAEDEDEALESLTGGAENEAGEHENAAEAEKSVSEAEITGEAESEPAREDGVNSTPEITAEPDHEEGRDGLESAEEEPFIGPEIKEEPEISGGEPAGSGAENTGGPESEPAKKPGVKDKIESLQESLEKLQKKYGQARDILTDAENQKTFRLLYRQILFLFKHILPRKLKGNIRFGFEDPYNTGRVLTAISPFYALYAKTVEVVPVFDEKVLEGELHLKGHIRAATLLFAAARVLINKNFRRLLKKVRRAASGAPNTKHGT